MAVLYLMYSLYRLFTSSTRYIVVAETDSFDIVCSDYRENPDHLTQAILISNVMNDPGCARASFRAIDKDCAQAKMANCTDTI